MLKVESYKRGIVLSTVFNVFNKGLVFLNGLTVAYFFSANERTDFYFYIYNSLIILSAFFMSMNSSVIIPESMRIRNEEGNIQSIGFLNFFLYLYTSLMFIGVLIVLVDPISFFTFVSNFDRDQLFENRHLLYLSLPIFGLSCLITLMIDILTSHKFFTISMLTGIINGLLSIFIIFALNKQAGIASAFYGLVSSYALNFIILIYLFKKKLNWQFNVVRTSISKRIWKNIGFAQLGNLLSTLSLYTPIYVFSGFNKGIITALTFAQQISALPNNLITTQFSSVAGIKLNELFASAKVDEINKVFTEAANFLHFIMLPLSLMMFFYSTEIVSLLIQFTSIDNNVGYYIAIFMKYLGLLLPFYVSNTLISRLFMASHKIKEAFWYQVIFNMIQVAFVYFGIKQFGPESYPKILIIIYVINTFSSYFIEKRYFNLIGYIQILKNLLVFTMVNVSVSTVVYFFIKSIDISTPWLILPIAFACNLLLLFLINRIFKMNESISGHLDGFILLIKNKIFMKRQNLNNGI